jgi:plasmid maintenance system killer protein
MKISLLIIFIALFCIVSNAQSDWKSKNFETWTKADVETILNNSAWAKSQEIRLQYEGQYTPTAGANVLAVSSTLGVGSTTGSLQPALDFTFTLRLRSSLAIRLAMIRKNQLETDIKKLTKEQLEVFNKKQSGLYACPACKNYYVLTLTSKSRENKNYDAVFTSFANAKIEDIKRYIYLVNDKGEKRELVNFVPPKTAGEEAIFFFPRNDEKGNPLFTKESKFLIFNTTNNSVNTATNFKIEIKPLIVADKVNF